MRVLVDANFLIYLIDYRDKGPGVEKDRHDKLQGVLAEVQAQRGDILIPPPVLTEYLLNADEAGQTILERFQKNRGVQVAAFDALAAHVCADLHRAAIKAGGHKRAPLPKTAQWQKVKVDWQVVAIAKARSCDLIVTNDSDVLTLGQAAGIKCQKLDDLPIPEALRQIPLTLPPMPDSPPVAQPTAPQVPAT